MDTRKGITPFSDAYGRLLEEFGRQGVRGGREQVGERQPSWGEARRNVREEIVRCLWFGGHFPQGGRADSSPLTTDDGRRIEVLSPGWWNVEGGPDFIRAELLLEGSGRVVGDVEVHTFASAWSAHGHDRQPEYNDVVLHVVMWNDSEASEARLYSGQVIPQLTLSRFVEEELEELVEIVDMDGGPSRDEPPVVPGRYCGEAIAEGKISAEWLERLLDCAGDYRLLTKMGRFRGLQEKVLREQTLYASLAEALGYKNNRMPFLQLAKLLPVRRLREIVPSDAPASERRTVLDAALLGVAGFLEGAEGEDEETRSYVAALRERWEQFPAELREQRMSSGHWTFAGTRPASYPARRIAALSCLYAEHLQAGLFGHLVRVVRGVRAEGRRRLDTSLRDALTGVFIALDHPYWSSRYALGGKKLDVPRSLVGGESAMSFIVDVLIPLLLAHTEGQGAEAQPSPDDDELVRRLRLLWSGLPRRAPNSVVRRMCQVLFREPADAARIVNSARRQQGLHQLHSDACGSEDGCRRCVLYLAHSAGKTLTEV